MSKQFYITAGEMRQLRLMVNPDVADEAPVPVPHVAVVGRAVRNVRECYELEGKYAESIGYYDIANNCRDAVESIDRLVASLKARYRVN